MAATIRTMAGLVVASFLGGCVAVPRAPSGLPSSADPEAADRDEAAVMAFIVRAQLAEELDNDSGVAAAAYEKAARLAPDRIDLAMRAALHHLSNEAPAAAAEFLRWALERHPASAEAHFAMGHILQADRADRDGARKHYQQAIDLAPVYPAPVLGLAAMAWEDGQPAAAADILKHAVTRGINDRQIISALNDLAVFFMAAGRYEEALSCWLGLLPVRPLALDIRRALALVYARLDRHDSARAVLEEWHLATVHPGWIADLLGDVYDTVHDDQRAVEFSLAAIAEADAPLTAWLRAGRLLLASDPVRAAALMAHAVERHPDIEMLWLFRGLAYSALDRYHEAVTALEQAAALSEARQPEQRHLPALLDFWMGAAYERVGRHADAERHFRISIERHPEIHQSFNYLAYMWAEQRTNLVEATDLVKTALAAEPDNGAYIDTLGWIKFQQGRHPEAWQHLQRALEIMPDDPVVNDHAGDALHALNRKEEALGYWKKSFRTDPSNDQVAAKLREAGIDPELLLQKE